jgi:hypothetical protein
VSIHGVMLPASVLPGKEIICGYIIISFTYMVLGNPEGSARRP